jgi:hypothetical protein
LIERHKKGVDARMRGHDDGGCRYATGSRLGADRSPVVAREQRDQHRQRDQDHDRRERHAAFVSGHPSNG